jgi:quinolinate synthase
MSMELYTGTTAGFVAVKIHISHVSWIGSPEVNMWPGLMHKLTELFLFSEKTVTGCSHLNMLELYALLQLLPQNILQQDRVPPHFCHHAKNHLDREMGERLIGRR